MLASTSAILALVTAAHTILETARDTLFLTRLPPSRLAWVYVVLAGLSILAAALSSAISRRFGRRAGFVVTLAICAYLIVLLYLREPTPVMVFVLYVTSGVIGTILTLQFWLFAGQLFTVSQGKRLFGALGAGGVVGATVGATVAALLLRVTSPSTLLFIGASLFLCAGLVVTLVPAAEGVDEEDASPVRAFSWLGDVSLLRADRYVALTAGLVVLSTATVLVADYLFKSTAVATLGPDRLGPFLGAFYAAQNALALVVQLVLTGTLLRRLGVTTTLLLFPILLLTGGVGMVFTGAFGMALALKATDGSLRHSLHRVTTELLLLPLPGDLRDRAKRLIDTLLGRGAQAVAAGGIVALSALGYADPRTLGLLLSGLALAWVGAALALRAPYVDVFRRALVRGEIPETDRELDISAVEAILASLASPDDSQVIAAIDLLSNTKRQRLVPALILYHESPKVLEHALGVFAVGDRRDFAPLAERLLGHREPGVRAAAVRALAAAGDRPAAETALGDADPTVRAYAAFFLAFDADEPHGDPRIEAMLDERAPDRASLRDGLLRVIGEHGDERWRRVVRDIVTSDGNARALGPAAAASIRRTGDGSLAPFLVGQLALREGRAAYRDALVSLGDVGFDALRRALADEGCPLSIRRQVPRAIAAFGTQSAVDLLVRALASEPTTTVQYRLLRALGRLSTDSKNGLVGKLKLDRSELEAHARAALTEYLSLFETILALDPSHERSADPGSSSRASSSPRPDFGPDGPGSGPVGDVLVGLLRDRLASALERAFRFLQLAHRNEDLESVHHAVVRGDRRARSTALEFLDVLTIGEPSVRALLRVVVDDHDPTERAMRARALVSPSSKSPSHDEAIKRLIRDEDALLAALASAYALEVDRPELVTLARQEAERRPELRRLGANQPVPRLTLSHA